MQLIAEIYDVLKQLANCSNEEMSDIFTEWNKTELESFLVEITAIILNHKDDAASGGATAANTSNSSNTSEYVVDKILDKTGMKGTGRWTIQEAAERSVAIPSISASLDARYLSARKEERVAASKILKGPTEKPSVVKQQIIDDCKHALYCAKICCYAQGMCTIKAASDQVPYD